MNQVVQIVPRLPPSSCGVGDYALELARQWRSEHDLETTFIVADPAWKGQVLVDGFPTVVIPSRAANALADVLRSVHCDRVVVQYSGYGFHEQGAPFWLITGLQMAQASVLSMFHELFASGPVTSKSFWMSPFQKRATASLARFSRRGFTNRQASARWLESKAPHLRSRLLCLPVFSNLGETTAPTAPSARPATMTLFQAPCVTSGTAAAFWSAFALAAKLYRPDRIVAAGRCGKLPANVQIEKVGFLPAPEASRLLQNSRWLLMDYYDGYLAKSGIFAAGAAHGVGTMLASSNHSQADGLEEARHYVTNSSAAEFTTASKLDCIASNLWTWYRTHDIRTAARTFATEVHLLNR